MMNKLFTEIGVGLAGFGVAFLFLGMLLLFDKGLLAVGNVSFVTLSPNYDQKCQKSTLITLRRKRTVTLLKKLQSYYRIGFHP